MSDISNLASQIVASAAGQQIIAMAESCTGGMVAAAITDIAGSSAVLDRGFVTYSNEAKMEMLGVSADTLATHGAVSKETAIEMVGGVLANAPAATIAVSITGIAGPGGGSHDKPVGLIHFASQYRGEDAIASMQIFAGDRAEIRQQATYHALIMINNYL
ncbi:CinA family protein [Alphaproteobacteria bacterium]|nr:CinA family protein [Alphaproteobacteria bacterium]